MAATESATLAARIRERPAVDVLQILSERDAHHQNDAGQQHNNHSHCFHGCLLAPVFRALSLRRIPPFDTRDPMQHTEPPSQTGPYNRRMVPTPALMASQGQIIPCRWKEKPGRMDRVCDATRIAPANPEELVKTAAGPHPGANR